MRTTGQAASKADSGFQSEGTPFLSLPRGPFSLFGFQESQFGVADSLLLLQCGPHHPLLPACWAPDLCSVEAAESEHVLVLREQRLEQLISGSLETGVAC